MINSLFSLQNYAICFTLPEVKFVPHCCVFLTVEAEKLNDAIPIALQKCDYFSLGLKYCAILINYIFEDRSLFNIAGIRY